MTRYHSITCTDPCPGWGCGCWCHDCKATPVDNPWKTPVDNGKHTDVAILGAQLKTAPAVLVTPWSGA